MNGTGRLNRREMLVGAAAAAATTLLGAASEKRLLIDTHLEVWTLDPKFPFNHPEAGAKLNVKEPAPIENQVQQMRNFDIRFSLIVAVMVGVIAILADFFLRFTFWGGARSRGSREGGGGAQAVIFIVAIILAVLAPLISRFIQLAVSRQREYLADASSVELTRNPYGLERALAKISADQEVLEVANRGTQHLYFTNPIKKFEERSSSLMSTHPAIIDRINRLRQLTGEPPLGTAEAAQLAGLD